MVVVDGVSDCVRLSAIEVGDEVMVFTTEVDGSEGVVVVGLGSKVVCCVVGGS